jgi:hypothetical protein
MTGNDGLDDMRHHSSIPEFRSDPLALDEGTAERLLGGVLDPADAPPAYKRAAMVLDAIAAPPSSDELADEAAAVATLAAVARSSPNRARRRPTVLTKVLTAKMAAAAAIAALSVTGVAAAATGTLPDPAQRVAHQMLGAAGVPAPDNGSQDTKGAANGDHEATGPDASGAARDGLCRAWQAGQGGDHGRRNDSTAFKALATAAGGSDKIADYCKDSLAESQSGETKGAEAGTGTPSSTVPAQREEHASDQGAGSGQSSDDHGQGDGQGQGQGGSPPSTTPDPQR